MVVFLYDFFSVSVFALLVYAIAEIMRRGAVSGSINFTLWILVLAALSAWLMTKPELQNQYLSRWATALVGFIVGVILILVT